MSASQLLREDLVWIAGHVRTGENVLDLGCGDGALLAKLRDEKGCKVHGIEIDQSLAIKTVAKGISVSCIDLDDGLGMFDDKTFDTVILSLTLQMVLRPESLMKEMLRVSKRCVVSYPNFGYWRVRTYLMFLGRMPVSKSIPYSWYETPNIHHTTIKDFHDLVADCSGSIEEEIVFSKNRDKTMSEVRIAPNLFGETVVARIRPKES